MKNILNRIKEIYEEFDDMYFHDKQVTCGDCFVCCTSKTGYPKLSSMEYDFLEDFIVRNNLNISAENIKKYMMGNGREICPSYNNGCLVYEARPLCCRVFGLFKFEKDRELPDGCAFRNNITPVSDSEKYSVIKSLGEFLELKYKYEILKIDKEEKRLEALISLGEEYIRQNKTSEALSVFQRGEKISPHNMKILFNFGFIYRAMGEMEKAIDKLEESIRAGGDKEYPYIYQNLGFIYLGLNLIEKADGYFRKALVAEPLEALPYIGMAFCESSVGHYDVAKEYALKALKIEPNNNLAVSLAKCLD